MKKLIKLVTVTSIKVKAFNLIMRQVVRSHSYYFMFCYCTPMSLQ